MYFKFFLHRHIAKYGNNLHKTMTRGFLKLKSKNHLKLYFANNVVNYFKFIVNSVVNYFKFIVILVVMSNFNFHSICDQEIKEKHKHKLFFPSINKL